MGRQTRRFWDGLLKSYFSFGLCTSPGPQTWPSYIPFYCRSTSRQSVYSTISALYAKPGTRIVENGWFPLLRNSRSQLWLLAVPIGAIIPCFSVDHNARWNLLPYSSTARYDECRHVPSVCSGISTARRSLTPHPIVAQWFSFAYKDDWQSSRLNTSPLHFQCLVQHHAAPVEMRPILRQHTLMWSIDIVGRFRFDSKRIDGIWQMD